MAPGCGRGATARMPLSKWPAETRQTQHMPLRFSCTRRPRSIPLPFLNARSSSAPKWGDTVVSKDFLPPPTETGPDADGVRTRIEYRRNAAGKIEKVTRRIRTVTKETRIPLAVAERRRTWAPFGDAVGQGAEISKTSYEDIRIERPGVMQKSEADQLMEKTSLFTCRKCGGAHSTLKCPVGARMAELGMTGPGAGGPGGADGAGAGAGAGGAEAAADGKPGKYVAPGARRQTSAGSASASGGDAPVEELRSLRVSSLSTDATEDDLRALFSPFGHVERIYVARDRETGESRGFAFVTFAFHDHADRARQQLHGHPYDHLILQVSWAQPSSRDVGSMGAMSAGHISGYGKALPQNPSRKP